jgi:2-polyprenyl-3-methyl-5-hydroxy-6-metoxy-1,4-benzoquinol methylase
MSAVACRICEGELEPFRAGRAGAPTPADFAPSNHRPGEHGALFRCRTCGTVQQPGLPSGDDLHDLYREMSDDAYLAEEAGRRATARRVLGLIAPHVPGGRLLDVGCGHGLLLDEARRMGYDVLGLELSRTAARHATGTLGLDVLQEPVEGFAASTSDRFDVIVLADVIEHLDDPAATLDACAALLADGGVLCVITPDPSAPLARLAGPRWWGYVPAHTCLLPGRTLRELLSARGLVISADVPLVRSFALRYWIAGLSERGGRAGGLLRRAAATPFGGRQVSLSLGDERVVLAHRVPVVRPDAPLATDDGTPPRVTVVLPAYRAASTIAAVAQALPIDVVDRALLVDDASPDTTPEAALRAGFELLRLPANRGYGGNQKAGYTRALLDGADIVVMVHADNQYDPSLVERMIRPLEAGIADVVMGSRLLEDETIAGGMPRWKWVGNRVLTAVENLAFRRGFSEYHTGYRAYSADFLRRVAFLRNSDDFVFDQEMFAQIVASRSHVVELPIPTRYFLEASSVSFRASVRYGLKTLWVLVRFRLHQRGRTWPVLQPPAAPLPAPSGRDAAAAG